MAIKPNNIDDYITAFPDETKRLLQQVRRTIKKAAPDAEETISYAMPAFKLKGRSIIYFAAYKNHIGLYPVPTGNSVFEKDFEAYKTSGKGTIQFPLDKPMPLDIITKIVKFRIKESLEKAENKKIKKTTRG